MAFEDGEPVGIDFDGVYSVLDESYYKPLYIPQDIMNYINRSCYESTPQTKAMETYNHTRLPQNKGHTPAELVSAEEE